MFFLKICENGLGSYAKSWRYILPVYIISKYKYKFKYYMIFWNSLT